MSIIPKFASPCDLATELPSQIAEFLDIETNLSRRVREETITDILVASFTELNSMSVFAIVPKKESVTGNDLDLVIARRFPFEAVQYRIQAKKLQPNIQKWDQSLYPHLAYPDNTGAQSNKLVQSAANTTSILTIPLYAFYNPSKICDASGRQIHGIELADGRVIQKLVKAMVAAKPKRLPYKKLFILRNLFFPLSTLLCPRTFAGEPQTRDLTPLSSLENVLEEQRNALLRLQVSTVVNNTKRLISRQSNYEGRSRQSLILTERRAPAFLNHALEMSKRSETAVIHSTSVKRTKVIVICESRG